VIKMENVWKIGFLGLLVVAIAGLAMGFGPGVMENLTTEQEELVAQMQEVRAAGDMETAQELRSQLAEQLGIKGGFGRGIRGRGFGQMLGPGRMLDPEQHEALRQAVADNDWETYSSLVEEYGLEGLHSEITEETFPILIQIQEKEEELNTLRTQLAEELGIEMGQGKGCRLGGGFLGNAGGTQGPPGFPGDEGGA
jgi:hypothetical protein